MFFVLGFFSISQVMTNAQANWTVQYLLLHITSEEVIAFINISSAPYYEQDLLTFLSRYFLMKKTNLKLLFHEV